jgi:nitrous oxidase accessory protein NosD
MPRHFNLSTWARRMAATWFGLRGPKKLQRRVARVGHIEQLERREMLTVYTVTTLNDVVNLDDGVTSLREALNFANFIAGPDTIQFAANLNGTISLTGGNMQISDSVTIIGNGSANTTIDAHQSSRVLALTSNATAVTIQGLTIKGGTATGENGGGIRSLANVNSTLNLIDTLVTGNTSTGPGGGIFLHNSGTLTVTDSKVTGNSTTGDNACGGGICGYYGGTLTVIDSEISGNIDDREYCERGRHVLVRWKLRL